MYVLFILICVSVIVLFSILDIVQKEISLPVIASSAALITALLMSVVALGTTCRNFEQNQSTKSADKKGIYS